MRKLRVTILTTSYPIKSGSYSGIFIACLVDHLPDQISRCIVVPADTAVTNPIVVSQLLSIFPFRYASKRMQILAHGPGGIPVALKNHKWLYLLLPQFLVAMFISCLRNANKSDVIHANWAICGLIGGIVGRILKIPVVTTLRGEDITRAQKHILDRLILSICMRFSTRVVCVSHAIATWLGGEYQHLSRKICMIENGVSNELLQIHRHTKKHHEDEPIKMITVGSLIPRKGIDQIILAMVKLKQICKIHLTIVGDGPEKENLKSLVAAHGLGNDVTFTGAASPDAITKLLAQSDVFILASHSEGRPNAVLEAMAAALPVIATNIDGVNELINHGHTGLLFEDNAVDELASCIQSLAESEEKRINLGLEARASLIAHGLLWSNTGRRYALLYQTLLEEPSTCAG